MEESNELVVFVNNSGMEEEAGKTLLELFNPFFEQAAMWKANAETIKVTDVSQTTEMAQAREGRLVLRSIRVDLDKKRKELKEESLRTGKAIDGVAKKIRELIEPTEKYLGDQEKFAEIEAEKEKAALVAKREAELAPFVEDVKFFDLANMPEEGYQTLLTTCKLAKENEAKEAAAAAKAEEDRLASEAALIKIKEEENEKLRIENKRLEDERLEREAAELEEKRLANEAAMAPDKDKMAALAETIDNLEMPHVESEEAKQIISDTVGLLGKTSTYLRENSELL